MRYLARRIAPCLLLLAAVALPPRLAARGGGDAADWPEGVKVVYIHRGERIAGYLPSAPAVLDQAGNPARLQIRTLGRTTREASGFVAAQGPRSCDRRLAQECEGTARGRSPGGQASDHSLVALPGWQAHLGTTRRRRRRGTHPPPSLLELPVGGGKAEGLLVVEVVWTERTEPVNASLRIRWKSVQAALRAEAGSGQLGEDTVKATAARPSSRAGP